VAMAVSKFCSDSPCFDTNDADTLQGTPGADGMFALGGNDVLIGWEGNDVLHGEGGDDRIDGGVGTDVMTGSGGYDKFWGGSGNDKYNGGGDNDWMYDSSTSSNDTYFVRSNEKYDTVRDAGGTGDIVELLSLDRTQYLITWVDTSADTDTRRDASRIQQKGTAFLRNQTTCSSTTTLTTRAGRAGGSVPSSPSVSMGAQQP
jgi:Ca2+-binding RTX toxin-like protein